MNSTERSNCNRVMAIVDSISRLQEDRLWPIELKYN
jgi:hypothetical protein